MNPLTSILLIFTLFLALTNVGQSTCDSLDGPKKTGLKNDSPTKIFAAYRESYITKNDAKKFRQRIKNHKKPYIDKDYEDLIQEIHFKPKQQPKQAMYEKKYFDYLPADMLESAFKETKGSRNTDDTKVEFMEIEDFAKLHQARNKSRRTNSRRMRRHADPYGYAQEILHYTPVVYHVEPHPIYHRAIQPSGYFVQPNLVQSYVPVVADWGRQPYLPPRPDRGYLPTATGPKKPMRNPGEPSKNPMKTPAKKPDGSTINRFDLDGMEVLVFENAKDDRPKFSRFPGNSVAAPARPTTTRKPGRTTPPSIFHNSNDYDDDNTVVANKRPETSAPPTTQRPSGGSNRQRTTTRKSAGRTPPPLFHTVDYDDDGVSSVAGRNPETTRRPFSTRPTITTTAEPSPVADRPSQCTWAIVNCCTSVKSNTRYSCFESHGCSGFFFGVNPCTRQVVDAAMEETAKYFN